MSNKTHRLYEVQTTGLPPPRRNASKYPWHEMTEAGKSFVVWIDDPAYFHIRKTAKKRQLRTNERYSCRIFIDEQTGRQGIRITRLADKPRG